MGHAIICEIAFQEMDRDARDEVKRLIRTDQEYRYFNDSCSWPDHPRKRAKEHYINVPRSFSHIGTSSCQMGATKCLFTAIASDKTVLQDPSASDAEKLEALKFLGHWVGDIHQPMHVSFQDDRGGNSIRESGSCKYGLHAVWDSCIIRQRLGTNARSIADDLRASITDAQRADWTNSTEAEWADDAFKIAIQPSVEYCVMKQGACWYEENNQTLDQGEPEKTVVVDAAYLDAHDDEVKEQLTKAGVRLGALLNDLLD